MKQIIEFFRSNKTACQQLITWLLFPLIFFYYEMIFKISTTGRMFSVGTFFTLMFGCVYGWICSLLVSLCKKEKVNEILTAVLIGFSALPFIVEYFVFQAFRIFYDLNTVIGGAGDAIGGFGKDIVRLVFGISGLLHILLFLLPLILYLILGRRFLPAAKANVRMRILSVWGILFFYIVSFVIISLNPRFGQMYQQKYNYQTAVENFGLMTGMRLDIRKALFGTSVSFEQMAEETEGETDEKAIEKEIVYGYNRMDLDFEALSESTDGTWAELDRYVSSLTPSRKNEYTGLFEGKNLIMISAEAFCAEVIDPELTPTLYRLATKGMNFTDYYEPASAGTTGGECTNLLGLLPTAGGMSLKQTVDYNLYFTMGNQLNRLGYYGMAYHNNDDTYYERHLTHTNLGYSGGYMGYGTGMEAFVKDQWPQSDLEMFVGTLPTYINQQPFNIYYMSVSGHGPYDLENDMTRKNWDRVTDLNYSDTVKGYFAATLEFEDAMTYLVETLEKKGIADDTVICIAADHFPYGLDSDAPLGQMPYLSELYGEEVTNYLQRDHSRLIIWCGSLEKEAPIVVDSPTFSLDILPTLSNLFGLEYDSRLLPGRDVFSDAAPLVFTLYYDWKTELGTYIYATDTFTPASEDTVIPDNYVERINTIIHNKIQYCEGVLETNYYAHIFGEKAAD